MFQLKLLEEERGGGGAGPDAVAPAKYLAKMLPTPPQCPALSLHPPSCFVCLGVGRARGCGEGVGANAAADKGLPTPRADGVGGGQEIDEGLPTPPHLLYSTHPTQHCACLPDGGGEELCGGGGRRAVCKSS
jgi:hypothetical protein